RAAVSRLEQSPEQSAEADRKGVCRGEASWRFALSNGGKSRGDGEFEFPAARCPIIWQILSKAKSTSVWKHQGEFTAFSGRFPRMRFAAKPPHVPAQGAGG